MSRNAPSRHVVIRCTPNFEKRNEVSPCFSPQLQHHLCLGTQTIIITSQSVPTNAALQVRINSCIHPKLKIMLTFILTVLLEICVGSKGIDSKGHLGVHLLNLTYISGHK